MTNLLIKSAKHVAAHKLKIEFNDGHLQLADFSLFIYSSGHPDYEEESNFLSLIINEMLNMKTPSVLDVPVGMKIFIL